MSIEERTMTKEKAIDIIKIFEELAANFAEQGNVDVVANINASLADFVQKHAELLNQQ